MTDGELKAIEARANAATPEPWKTGEPFDGVTYIGTSGIEGYNFSARSHDAHFIAHARTDIPALIHALREERQALRAAREALREIKAIDDWRCDPAAKIARKALGEE